MRHKGTGQYLQGHCAWTSHLDSAMQFNSGLRLLDYLQDQAGIREKEERLEILVLPAPQQAAPTTRL